MDESERSRIESWLEAEGWSVSERDHGASEWLLVAEDPARRRLIVARAERPPGQIRIQAAIDVAAEHTQRLAGLPPAVREPALWGLRFRLLQMNVEFQGLAHPLKRVSVGQKIYLDGLTQDRFMQRVAVTKNALLTVVWTILNLLGDSPPPGGEAETLVH